MNINVKLLHKDAKLPKYAHSTDGAADLIAVSIKEQPGFIEYGIGISIELPEDHIGLIFPRSSISNTSMGLANSIGLIDESYRGEIKVRMRNAYPGSPYSVGDRVAQLLIVPRPKVNYVETNEISVTERGDGGFGSTGA